MHALIVRRALTLGDGKVSYHVKLYQPIVQFICLFHKRYGHAKFRDRGPASAVNDRSKEKFKQFIACVKMLLFFHQLQIKHGPLSILWVIYLIWKCTFTVLNRYSLRVYQHVFFLTISSHDSQLHFGKQVLRTCAYITVV